MAESPMGERRFVESDLRRSPDLLQTAIDYAEGYMGEFDFMVAAQALVAQTGTLPLPIAKAVLNCMRADPYVAISTPTSVAKPRPRRTAQSASVVPIRPPEPHARERVYVQARRHPPYVAPRTKNGVLHKVLNVVVLFQRKPAPDYFIYTHWIRKHGNVQQWGEVTAKVQHGGFGYKNPCFFWELPDMARCRSGCWE